jgi:hypothetical protein
MFKNPHFLRRNNPNRWKRLTSLFAAVVSRGRSLRGAMRHFQTPSHK